MTGVPFADIQSIGRIFTTEQQEYLSKPLYLLRTFRIKKAPTTPAATATPLTIATPIRPSLATLSSTSCRRLDACRFAGSFSSRRSLYRLASP
ncbi:hypothetical protein HYQ46_008843 [Verticillium longisporum]|nr:hypothetical protein HYQ46_008843 [Verticillium longisporum]